MCIYIYTLYTCTVLESQMYPTAGYSIYILTPYTPHTTCASSPHLPSHCVHSACTHLQRGFGVFKIGSAKETPKIRKRNP